MSRKIDHTKPLSEEDKQYLLTRNRHDVLLWNQRYLEGTGQSEEKTNDEMLKEAMQWIESATAQQLRDRLGDWKLSTEGKKPELQERLRLAVKEEYGEPETDEDPDTDEDDESDEDEG